MTANIVVIKTIHNSERNQLKMYKLQQVVKNDISQVVLSV